MILLFHLTHLLIPLQQILWTCPAFWSSVTLTSEKVFIMFLLDYCNSFLPGVLASFLAHSNHSFRSTNQLMPLFKILQHSLWLTELFMLSYLPTNPSFVPFQHQAHSLSRVCELALPLLGESDLLSLSCPVQSFSPSHLKCHLHKDSSPGHPPTVIHHPILILMETLITVWQFNCLLVCFSLTSPHQNVNSLRAVTLSISFK